MVITDEMLRGSAETACQIYLESIDREFAAAPEHKFSARFERRMKRMIREQKRTPLMNSLISVMKKVAVFFIVLLIGSTVVTVSVEAYRTRFISFVKKITGKTTTYEYRIGDVPYLQADLARSVTGYIPETFRVTRLETSARHYYAHYADGNGHDFSLELTFVDASSTGFVSIDTEDSELKEVYVNENEAVLNTKDDERQLIWSVNNVLCLLAGNIEESEMLRIAEAVEIIFED